MTWIWIVLFLGIVANTFRLRVRARALAKLPVDPGVPLDPAAGGREDWAFLVARGVELTDATRSAAMAYARANDLGVVDLIPRDLSSEPALLFVRVFDPATYRRDRLVPGRGAGHAILVERSVLSRARLEPSEASSATELAEATAQLKRYAPGRTDVAVARDLGALPPESAERLRFWRAVFGGSLPIVFGFQLAETALLALGLVIAPVWALAALVAFQVQPLLVFGGSAIEPRDRRAQLLGRWLRVVRRSLRVLGTTDADAADPADRGAVAGHEVQVARERQQAEREYAEKLRGGFEKLFEPRRSDCPQCGSRDLRLRVTSRDFFHHKPGEFRLEQCRGCGHVFQNPRLSFEGLDFYYKDFYSGAWEGPVETVFASGVEAYRTRAETLRGHAEPERWLDVGTGQAHFCLIASESWPKTQFDGLDLSENVEEAQRRGWIEQGYRGLFTEMAPKLEGAYDVVSMHHYLEHTPDPWAELDAAALALRPGGHLLIEVPDPDCKLGHVFGKRWISWFQPQHLNFVTLGNLKRALAERGFEALCEDRGSAHIPADLSFFWYTVLEDLAPVYGMPWQPKATRFRQIWRTLVFCTLGPGFALTLTLDRLIGFVLARTGAAGNTYRLLARKPA